MHAIIHSRTNKGDRMKKHYYNYVGVYAFTYGAMGMMLPLLGQYLDRLGFSGVEIGSTVATGTAVAIFASIFWGDIYNNSRNKKQVILFLCVITFLLSISLAFISTYLLFLIAFGVLYFFQSPVLALQDAMTLEDGQHFGAIRKWGAIGFALGNLIASQVVSLLGLGTIFYLYSIGYVAAAVMVISIIRANKRRGTMDGGFNQMVEPEQVKGKYRELVANKKFVLLIISAFFVSGTNVANNTYFGFLYVAGGGAIAGIAIAFLLMVGSEAVFMAWSDKLAARFTLERTILFSMVISVLRYLLYSMVPSNELLIITFFLQGMVNGIVLVEFVRYISKLVETRLLGMAVSVYYCVSCNISTIICQLLGGVILDFYDVGAVYLFFAVYNLIGLILYLLWSLHKPEKNM